MTHTLLDVARAYWPVNTYYTPFEVLTLDDMAIYAPSNPAFVADAIQLDAPTAPDKTPPATVIIERLNWSRSAGFGMYQTTYLASHIRKGTMLDTNAVIATITPATATTIGAELRHSVAVASDAQIASALRMVGGIDVQLARNSDKWRLYLQDVAAPVPHEACDLWATAVGAPSVEWARTPDGCLVWCEWRE